MNLIYVLISMILGYGFGCFQTAYFIGKMNQIDIREHGSGNAGTTNALRTLGKGAALCTFLGDALKGMIAVWIVRFFIAPLVPELNPTFLSLITGFFAVLGHNFPFFLNFKGGKGIATTAAITMAIDWRMGLISLIIFVTLCVITRYVSVASITLLIAFPITMTIFHGKEKGYISMLLVAFCYTALGIYRHRANIERLKNGTENRLGTKKNV
ncbi:MAG: glycerol-3-phosphate 1-O-acyltransferase PlsY [Firmicutes bacterium]|uniref:Glycerol-3-phosphate acyltransferase n=1 Tax=Candidatus Scybalomonas excrementavium TaxID=2840943 RepID=A0A9D9I099_9FIRM|nr:glycerol-3-phosphate 1-O-acyltransferase PlsY [Candidatus Scybalomonas excrementavium]